MSKQKFRKATPQPPHYYWLNSDGCWDCNCNRHGCRNCKRLKEQRDIERKSRKRKQKNDLRKIDFSEK